MKRKLEIRGVSYALEETGHGIPLLLLHGFTGSKAAFEPLMDGWKSSFHLIAPDLLGHGETDAPDQPERYSMEETCQDLREILGALRIAKVCILGYSMGGRTALAFTSRYPHHVECLVLEGASPGLDDPLARQSRIASDEALAAKIEADGVASFVDHWEKIPLFASQRSLPKEVFLRQRAIRLNQRASGLANSLRGMGTGRQSSIWDALPDIGIPTLLITGAKDEKFTEINRRMQRSLKDARHAVLANAGHTPHIEMPDRFSEIVHSFILGAS